MHSFANYWPKISGAWAGTGCETKCSRSAPWLIASGAQRALRTQQRLDRAALVVVLDGRLGVVRRLLREEFRAEEPRVDDGGGDAERRDLGVQRLHPALQAELRRGVGGTELEADEARCRGNRDNAP